jgi:hypothetical protein
MAVSIAAMTAKPGASDKVPIPGLRIDLPEIDWL